MTAEEKDQWYVESSRMNSDIIPMIGMPVIDVDGILGTVVGIIPPRPPFDRDLGTVTVMTKDFYFREYTIDGWKKFLRIDDEAIYTQGMNN